MHSAARGQGWASYVCAPPRTPRSLSGTTRVCKNLILHLTAHSSGGLGERPRCGAGLARMGSGHSRSRKFFIREREHISTLRWRWRPALHVAAAARGASAIRHTATIASAPRRARCCTFAAARLSPTAPARATEGEFGASGGEWTAARRWHRRHFCRLAARGDGPGPPRRAAAPLDRAAVVDCAIHGPLLGARARDWRRAGGAARLPGARRAQPRRDLCLHGGGRRHLDPHHRRQRRA